MMNETRTFSIPEGIVTNLTYLKHTHCDTVYHYTQMAVMSLLMNQI
jgi:hypothetical protein